MSGQSVSFRITRTTEDLAQTVAALSHRLVKLEQRLGVLELQLEQQLEQLTSSPEPDPDELRRLESVELLLADCRSLLDESADADASPPLAA
jgi:DNA-binding transcriptional LysR family regulator